jgi:hypothetical protein
VLDVGLAKLLFFPVHISKRPLDAVGLLGVRFKAQGVFANWKEVVKVVSEEKSTSI